MRTKVNSFVGKFSRGSGAAFFKRRPQRGLGQSPKVLHLLSQCLQGVGEAADAVDDAGFHCFAAVDD